MFRLKIAPRPLCIFCEKPKKLSKEHIFSKWTYQFVPRDPTGSHIRESRESTPGSSPFILNKINKNSFNGSLNTIKFEVVCERHCNNGWMSAVDDATKDILSPVLTSSPTSFDKDDAQILSTWVAMKLMVAEYSTPKDVSTLQSERSLLMLKREPPPGWKIWMFRHHGTAWRTAYIRNAATLGSFEQSLLPLPEGDALAKNTQSATWGIGPVAFQVIATSMPGLEFELPLPARIYSRQIWPFAGPVDWPPPASLSDHGVGDMALALGRLEKIFPWANPRRTS